jgi:hypothetical protein
VAYRADMSQRRPPSRAVQGTARLISGAASVAMFTVAVLGGFLAGVILGAVLAAWVWDQAWIPWVAGLVGAWFGYVVYRMILVGVDREVAAEDGMIRMGEQDDEH